MAAVWNAEKTAELIVLYEERSRFWDVTADDYHNKPKRNAAIQEIAVRMETTEKEVCCKIKSLRSQYAREKAKLNSKSKKSGSGVDDNVQLKWTHFKSLQFLDSAVNARASKSNIETKESNNNENLVSDENEKITQEVVLSDHEDVIDDCAVNENSSTKKPITAKKRKVQRNNSDGVLNQAVSYLGTVSQHITKKDSKEPDNDEVFAKYVASELRQVVNPQIKRLAKHRIENVLFEANYTYPATSSRSRHYSYQQNLIQEQFLPTNQFSNFPINSPDLSQASTGNSLMQNSNSDCSPGLSYQVL